MGIGIVALLTSLLVAAIAAYFSIAGLMAIFSGAALAVAVMAGSLEVAKLVTASWLYRNWKQTGYFLKTYLTVAVFVLMIITSLGIFGYLSKAHLDKAVPTGDVAAQVQLIDERISIQEDNIKSQRENITAARATLGQMDAQVSARLDRGTSEASAERSIQIRRGQASERRALQGEITKSQQEIEKSNSEIAKLREEKAPIAGELRKVEAEVGPIKYVAALIYGDNPDANLLERAVRWMIILLVAVFDPLAVALLIAANQSLSRHGIHLEKPDPEPKPKDKDDEIKEDSVSTEIDPDIEDKQIPLDFEEQDQKKRSLSWKDYSLKNPKQLWSTLTDWSKSPVLNASLRLKNLLKRS
jgi:hypothetical protein